jgi:hypothetical protein
MMTLRSIVLSSSCLAVGLALTACDKPAPTPDSPQAPVTKDPKAEPKPVPAVAAVIGKPAPDFTLTDLDGKAHTLSQYAGKTVVLEWFNPGCPFVEHAHGEGPLKDMAAKETAQGIVWLSINSGGPGKQGNGAEANREGVTRFGMTNPVLLDEDGTVGHTYGAEKTPHVFVVDAKGVLVYRGGLDNAPMGVPDEGERIDYVGAALADVRAGKPVAVSETSVYGCSVKYAKA